MGDLGRGITHTHRDYGHPEGDKVKEEIETNYFICPQTTNRILQLIRDGRKGWKGKEEVIFYIHAFLQYM